MNIAIIGGGPTGLTLAWLLSSLGKIDLYEKNFWLGGACGSLATTKNAQEDIDFVSSYLPCQESNVERSHYCFFPDYHQNIHSLFEYLNIYTEPCPTSYYCTGDNSLYLKSIPNKGLTFEAFSPWKNRIIKRDLNKFCRIVSSHYKVGNRPINLNLGQYINNMHLSNIAVNQAIIPLLGMIWHYPFNTVLSINAEKCMNFLNKSGLLKAKNNSMRCLVGGFNTYINKMLFRGRFNYYLNNPAQKVKLKESVLSVIDNKKRSRIYDRVIFTCDIKEMLGILDLSFERWHRVLEKVSYCSMPVFVHKDNSILGNFAQSKNVMGCQIFKENGLQQSSYYYKLHKLSNLSTDSPIHLSINPLDQPQEDKILYKTTWRRVAMDTVSQQAIKNIKEMQTSAGICFCSDWLDYDTSPMNGGINSAISLVKEMGIRLPFKVK